MSEKPLNLSDVVADDWRVVSNTTEPLYYNGALSEERVKILYSKDADVSLSEVSSSKVI